MSFRTSHYLFLGLLITGVGFALRLHNLGGDSLWLDEMLTIWTADGGLASMLAAPTHPPLTYILTAVSMALAGSSEFAVRLPALIAGTLSVPLCLKLGRVIRQPQAGLWLALLLALSPFHLKYAQEARHYALLLLLTLLSFILLFRAMQQPRRTTWFYFGLVTVLNLYNHYAAFVVLLAQSVWILGWWLWQPAAGRRVTVGHVGTAVAVVVLIYLPWLPRFWSGLVFNTGEEVAAHTGPRVSLLDWVGEAYTQFGFYATPRPQLFLLLALLGIAVLVWRRQWSILGLLTAAFLLPLLLIPVLPISRGAMGRYILYLLPFYLLPTALLLAAVMEQVRQRLPAPGTVLVGGLLAVGLGHMAWPVIQHEYEVMAADWRGILQYMEPQANDGDVLLTMSMNFPNGLNMVGDSLPYYLAQQPTTYQTITGRMLQPADIEMLLAADETVQVRAVVQNWLHPHLAVSESFVVEPFFSDLFVVAAQEPMGTVLERSIALYEQLVPLAGTPAPQCLLRQDLAYLYIVAGALEPARVALAEAEAACPEQGQAERERRRTLYLEAVLNQYMVEDKREAARATAVSLLQSYPKHEMALELLTVKSLLSRLERGQVVVEDSQAPEPVTVRQFTMPHNGDWGEVIFMHPPASAAYDLHLPALPTALSFRVANDPASWEWGGDGSTFVVTITTPDGHTTELYRHHVSNEPADREWHAAYISLADYAGQPVRLTLATEGGPQGDVTGAWAGWHRPKIVWQTDTVPPR
ncbi:MAG: glycosyltransferase family 39 protein [Chloroflexota bacterium]